MTAAAAKGGISPTAAKDNILASSRAAATSTSTEVPTAAVAAA